MPSSIISVRRLARLIGASKPKGSTYVVSIDGPSGAGKTSFAADLGREISPEQSVAVQHVDEFVPGWEGLSDVIPVLREHILAPLFEGKLARARRWNWADDVPGDWIRVPESEVLLLEGCASGSRSLEPYIDLSLWVDAPEAERYARAIGRDGEGHADWWDVWARQERALYARETTRERANGYIEGGAEQGWSVTLKESAPL